MFAKEIVCFLIATRARQTRAHFADSDDQETKCQRNDRGKSPTLFCFCFILCSSFRRLTIDIVYFGHLNTEQAWQLLTTLSSTPTDWATWRLRLRKLLVEFKLMLE